MRQRLQLGWLLLLYLHLRRLWLAALAASVAGLAVSGGTMAELGGV
jgi:hypothetical protein